MDFPKHSLTAIHEFGAELLGTFIILFIGNGCGGAMQLGVITGSWQAGIVWGLGVTCAVFASAPVSGAHLNPAVTLGMASYGKLELWKVPHYILGQFVGALAGASVIYSFFSTTIARFENSKEIIRGETGSFLSASMFRCTLDPDISTTRAIYIEFSITTMLLLIISFLNDKSVHYGLFFPPLMIGFTVAILTGSFSPLTSACMNPARDLGPRLLTYFAGWGSSAFPGEPQDPVLPFVCGPILGGIAGVWIWELLGSPVFKYAVESRRNSFGRLSSGMGSRVYDDLPDIIGENERKLLLQDIAD